jgi:hypothetical protein
MSGGSAAELLGQYAVDQLIAVGNDVSGVGIRALLMRPTAGLKV